MKLTCTARYVTRGPLPLWAWRVKRSSCGLSFNVAQHLHQPHIKMIHSIFLATFRPTALHAFCTLIGQLAPRTLGTHNFFHFSHANFPHRVPRLSAPVWQCAFFPINHKRHFTPVRSRQNLHHHTYWQDEGKENLPRHGHGIHHDDEHEHEHEQYAAIVDIECCRFLEAVAEAAWHTAIARRRNGFDFGRTHER